MCIRRELNVTNAAEAHNRERLPVPGVWKIMLPHSVASPFSGQTSVS
jgi:ribosomal protein S12 methylthiotransferase accessory factor YcaO